MHCPQSHACRGATSWSGAGRPAGSERKRWSMGLARRLEVATTLVIGVGSPGDGRLRIVQVARIHQGRAEAPSWHLPQPLELQQQCLLRTGPRGRVGRDLGTRDPVHEAAGRGWFWARPGPPASSVPPTLPPGTPRPTCLYYFYNCFCL